LNNLGILDIMEGAEFILVQVKKQKLNLRKWEEKKY